MPPALTGDGFISLFQEALGLGYMQRALISGSLIAITCAALGVFLVLRRFSMMGDGMAHVAFGSVGLALFAGVYPMYVAVPLVILASLGILRISERANVFGDAAIGLVSSLGIAFGVLFTSLGKGLNVDLFAYLFGDILTVSGAEVWASAFLAAAVIAAIILFYHDIGAVTYDPEHARVLGIGKSGVDRLLAVLTSLTIVLGIKVAGTMLVSSLIVLPAMTALLAARSFASAIALSMASALLSVLFGMTAAYAFDLPAGAAIVLVAFLFFVAAFLFSPARGGRK